MKDTIEHDGIVGKVDGDKVVVRIERMSACAECHAKSVCSTNDKSEKEIEALTLGAEFAVGESVKIIGQKSLGMRAVLLAYVVPFCIVIGAMVLLTALSDNELLNGTASLCCLIPYFVIMRLMNKKLESKFKFYAIKK